MILDYNGATPEIAEDAFIAPNATIIGNVKIGSKANIWFGAVLRGDEGQIIIGERTSIQDNVVIHCTPIHPTIVDADVTVGHSVVLEGCHIKKGALIGMNATALNGSVIEEGALVAAGSVVRQHQTISAHTLAAGVPAKEKGEMSEEARHHVGFAADVYQELMSHYMDISENK
ncbi:MAG: gamma carbonic anhydrase family protein [Chloroflexota bacterium]